LLKVERALPEDVPALMPLGVEPEAAWTLAMLELLLLLLPLSPPLLSPPLLEPPLEPPLLLELLLGVAADSLDVVVGVVWWVEDDEDNTCVVLDADAERDEVGALQEALRLRRFSGVWRLRILRG